MKLQDGHAGSPEPVVEGGAAAGDAARGVGHLDIRRFCGEALDEGIAKLQKYKTTSTAVHYIVF